MSRNLIYISYKLDSRVGNYERQVLDCLLTFGDQTIDAAVNIYPSNQTLADRLNISLSTIIRSKNKLETLGLIIRYYDESKHRDMIKIPFSALNEYMRDKSVAIEVSNSSESVTIEVSNRHEEVSNRHTTLHRPFLYNKGKYKKSEEEPILSSQSYIPIEQVREGSKTDMDFDKTSQLQKMNDTFKEMIAYLPGLVKINH